jgi:prepilin-type N-terminal cleavage/methylation domain-containing protein
MNKLKLNNQLNNKSNTKGFTIIEVVLVLAIAGLIFLMVFIALPALQRNQRDTQRKNDLSRTLTAIQSYQSNNRGQLPTDWSSFVVSYLKVGGDDYRDLDGSAYGFLGGTVGTVPTDMKYSTGSTIVYMFRNAKCDGENTVGGQGSNKVAFSMKLEGGGVYCVNN